MLEGPKDTPLVDAQVRVKCHGPRVNFFGFLSIFVNVPVHKQTTKEFEFRESKAYSIEIQVHES